MKNQVKKKSVVRAKQPRATQRQASPVFLEGIPRINPETVTVGGA